MGFPLLSLHLSRLPGTAKQAWQERKQATGNITEEQHCSRRSLKDILFLSECRGPAHPRDSEAEVTAGGCHEVLSRTGFRHVVYLGLPRFCAADGVRAEDVWNGFCV